MPASLLVRARPALLCLLLVALTFAVFAPALSAGFLAWDDVDNFVANTRYRGLGPSQLSWMFTTLHMGPYQPLSWMSLGFDYLCWGMDARGYHFTNVLLHALNALLCFACTRAFLRLVWKAESAHAAIDLGAAAAAALFAWHPLRVESVAWVSERRDVLAGCFLLLSLCAWLGYVGGGRTRACYWLAWLAFVASLGSKASALGWPLVLLALDEFPFRRALTTTRAALVREKLPFLAVALVFALVAWRGQSLLDGSMASWQEHGLAGRCAQASYGWLYYPLQTLVVAGVQPIYDLVLPLDLGEPRFVAALLLVPALLAAFVLLWKRAPWLATAFAAYTLLVAPVLGFAQTGPQLVAARYSYQPCLAFAVLAGAGVAWLALRKPRARTLLACALVLASAGLAASTRAATRAWRSDLELWTRARQLDPGSRVALRNLVAALHAEARASAEPEVQRRDLERGLALCDEGERLGADDQLWNARASLLAALAELEPARKAELESQALAALQRAIELARASGGDPSYAEENLARLLIGMQRAREALPVLRALCMRRPGNADAWALLGHALTDLGDAGPALAALERALEIDSTRSSAWLDKGLVLAALGEVAAARAAFETCVRTLAQRLGAGFESHPDAIEALGQLRLLAAKGR